MQRRGLLESFSVLRAKRVPIERVVGAGSLACAQLFVVVTALAVVTHAIDVGGAGYVRLGGQQAAVGELAHAEGVGEFDPFESVDIDAEIPAMYPQRGPVRPAAQSCRSPSVAGCGGRRPVRETGRWRGRDSASWSDRSRTTPAAPECGQRRSARHTPACAPSRSRDCTRASR